MKKVWTGGACTMYGKIRKCIQILAARPEGMGPLE
jgi:hypothetical protein